MLGFLVIMQFLVADTRAAQCPLCEIFIGSTTPRVGSEPSIISRLTILLNRAAIKERFEIKATLPAAATMVST